MTTSIDWLTRLANLEAAVFGGPDVAGTPYYEIEAASGAIGIKVGQAIITKSSAAAVMTLGLPTPTLDDNKILRVIATTAQAHTVAVDTNGFDGSAKLATFGGAVGDSMTMIAYQGVWYVITTRNVSLT